MEQQSLNGVKEYKLTLPDEASKLEVTRDEIIEFANCALQVIVFVSSKEAADKLHEALVEWEYQVTTIHDGLTQQARDEILRRFNKRFTRVLITIEPLAQGFEFDPAYRNLVVNYDLPLICGDSEQLDIDVYMNRLLSFKGAVFNLLCGDKDTTMMEKFERHINRSLIEVPSIDDIRSALTQAGI